MVVHTTDGLVLLLRRADIENFWQSVTGSMRWNEDRRQAAVRELREETGIVDAGEMVDWQHSARFRILDQFRRRYAPDTCHNLEHMFSLSVTPDHPIALHPREHTAYQWRHYSEAAQIVWSWSNREAIEMIANRYWE